MEMTHGLKEKRGKREVSLFLHSHLFNGPSLQQQLQGLLALLRELELVTVRWLQPNLVNNLSFKNISLK